LLTDIPYFEDIKTEAYEIAFMSVCTPIVARQRLRKHVSVTTNTHATIEELLEEVFSMRSGKGNSPRAYLIKHYAMKRIGSRCIDPHFLDLGTSWR
jgi:hypothetical protein